MKFREMGRSALKHVLNVVAEETYIHSGLGATKPVTFYGPVNERRNVKCRYCGYWRLPNNKDEMTITEWVACSRLCLALRPNLRWCAHPQPVVRPRRLGLCPGLGQ
jgi:hypothetical protein